VTVVSAILVLAIGQDKPGAILVAVLPVVLFSSLDAYYLSLERDFRDLYNSFVDDLHKNRPTDESIYLIRSKKGSVDRIRAVGYCFLSVSVLPFYGVLGAAVLIARIVA